MTKLIKIVCFFGFGLIFLCLISCEKKQEIKQADPPAKVISKTIVMPPPGKKTPDIPETDTIVEVKEVRDIKEMVTPPEPLPPGDPAAPADREKTAPPVEEALVKREKALAKAAEDMVNEANRVRKYDSKGRVDPFIPLLTEKQETAEDGESNRDKPKRILTPLEKMSLSQIKLVAVVQMKGRALAMVEEASGKGYEVRLGTYMGQNGGQVSAIHAESIVVKEYFTDFKGKRRERFQEIKFHNNEGGD